ncbi:MAG: hypothetical protein EXQ92_02765 [Alphaproteobacteria bacterium]|nr:hypothetical protein [Alphaproteobacteria bacterium]
MTAAEVEQVIAQSVHEARARSRAATIAVVDRVGNVLGVFRMTGATTNVRVVNNPSGTNTGLNGFNGPNAPQLSVSIPSLELDTAVSISKAITGAYLSSAGNAFSTRTASQIVQEHFNPGERFTPGGPLFGVQFSQLPCSDLNVRFSDGVHGPKRSPLGLSADPGGLPLYKNGAVVGGVGAIADEEYGADTNIRDTDTDDDELIALAGTVGLDAPIDIRANRITVDGKTLRYVDRGTGALASSPAAAASFAAIKGLGSLVAVRDYYLNTAVIAGQAYGTAASGYRPDTAGLYAPVNAFVLVHSINQVPNQPRFDPRAGTDGVNALSAGEVRVILRNALQIATRARAQIRRPLDSFAQVTVSIVDSNGVVLGLARTVDAPIFGTDVSLQKARSAMFFSHASAGSDLAATPTNLQNTSIANYVTAARNFLGASALTGQDAITDRAIGNLARPFFPDGIDGAANGPLSRPFSQWSPFSTGLQLDLVFDNIGTHVLYLNGPLLNAQGVVLGATDTGVGCTGLPVGATTGINRLANGLQIFPGGAPIYRSGALVGGIGVSGDGIDQDDMVAFLGLHNAGVELGTGIGHAPAATRSDRLTPQGVRLRYVNCPVAAFLGDRSRNVCDGK